MMRGASGQVAGGVNTNDTGNLVARLQIPSGQVAGSSGVKLWPGQRACHWPSV